MGSSLGVEQEMPPILGEQERLIFDEWRHHQAPYVHDGQFIEDGIVHYPTYEQVYPKVLFLLKEPNDSPVKDKNGIEQPRTDWNLAVWLGKGGCITPTQGYKTWEVVARWAHDITQSGQTRPSWVEIEKRISQHSIQERAAALRKVAVVNLKKSGGEGSTKMDELYDLLKETRKLILAQIRLYKPTVVVCGGTFVVYRDKIACESSDLKFTRRGIAWYLSIIIGVPIIDYPHYAYYPHLSPAIKPAMHYGLIDAVDEIIHDRD